MPEMERYPSGDEVMSQEDSKAAPEGATPEKGIEQIQGAIQTLTAFLQMLASKNIPGAQEAMQHMQAMIQALGKGGGEQAPQAPQSPQAPQAPKAPGGQAPSPGGARPMMAQGARPMNAPIM